LIICGINVFFFGGKQQLSYVIAVGKDFGNTAEKESCPRYRFSLNRYFFFLERAP